MRRKKEQEQGEGQGSPPVDRVRVTPEGVQQVEFRLAFRGYNERDVDAFLDQITEDLSFYVQENERLRTGADLPPAERAGPDAGADRIVAQARAEAEEIVRRAHEQAAGVLAADASGSEGARGAVAPFLNKERAFLQGLGTLVQTHAEEIKGMVMAIRARTEASAPGDGRAARSSQASAEGPEVPSASSAGGAHGTPPGLEPASAAEIRERLQTRQPPDGGTLRDEADLPATETEGAAEPAEPVVMEGSTEPAFSSEGSPATDARERSLRELFWGEE